jgi:hypothetical protein
MKGNSGGLHTLDVRDSGIGDPMWTAMHWSEKFAVNFVFRMEF